MQKHNPLKRGHWTAACLLLLFVLPFAAAHIVYGLRDTIPIKTTPSGNLLQPPLPATVLGFQDVASMGKWQLVYLRPQSCDAVCMDQIRLLNNIHCALGKHRNKVVVHTLASTQSSPLWADHSVWLLDPQGALVMHYPALSTSPKGILEDTRRLVRFSHIRS